MSYSEKALAHRLKMLGLQEGSGSIHDYEKAKKMIRDQNLTPDEFQKAIKKTTDFLRCEF